LLLIFDQKWLPFRAKGRSLFGSFFTPCPQGFPFMILVAFRLRFWHPFGLILVVVGIFLVPFCIEILPFDALIRKARAYHRKDPLRKNSSFQGHLGIIVLEQPQKNAYISHKGHLPH
jgi:hypothetical protein